MSETATTVCKNKALVLKMETAPNVYTCRVLYSARDFPSIPKCLVLFGNNDKSIIMDAQPAKIARGEIQASLMILGTLSLLLALPLENIRVTAMSGDILYKAYVDINVSQLDKDTTNKQIMDDIAKDINNRVVCKGDTLSVLGKDLLVEDVSFKPDECTCGCKKLISSITCFQHNTFNTGYAFTGRNTSLTVNTDFESMGVGGYSNVLTEIVRRVFMSRMMPGDLRTKQGIKHVAGMILHGPPGTGKTLIARTISKMIGYNVVVQRGPELLTKWLGESEQNVRKMFNDVTKPTVIVFDEMEALFAQRTSDQSEARGSIVNTLLAMIDGVSERSVDIFVIGTTNNIDAIDPAFRRPGRFECEFRIGLPSRDERKQILMIHAKNIIENNMVDGIDFDKLADTTTEFSGAQLEGLVRNSIMLANQRHVVHDGKSISFAHCDAVKVHQSDFQTAMSTANDKACVNMMYM